MSPIWRRDARQSHSNVESQKTQHIVQRGELRDLGAFPALVRGGTRAIAGKLYEVNAPTLFALDRLEGHPNFYRRARIRLASGTIADTYLLRRAQVDGRPIIESNDWRTRAEEP